MSEVKKVLVAKDNSEAFLTFGMEGVTVLKVRMLKEGMLQVIAKDQNTDGEYEVVCDNQNKVPLVRYFSCASLFRGFVAKEDKVALAAYTVLDNGDLEVKVTAEYA